MKARFFRLTQIHQRIDERIRLELRKRRPDVQALSQLEHKEQRVKQALRRLFGAPQAA
jgi:hypothetical protein